MPTLSYKYYEKKNQQPTNEQDSLLETSTFVSRGFPAHHQLRSHPVPGKKISFKELVQESIEWSQKQAKILSRKK